MTEIRKCWEPGRPSAFLADACYSYIDTPGAFRAQCGLTSGSQWIAFEKAHRRELERELTLASTARFKLEIRVPLFRNLLLQVIRRNLALHAQSYSRAPPFGEAMNIT